MFITIDYLDIIDFSQTHKFLDTKRFYYFVASIFLWILLLTLKALVFHNFLNIVITEWKNCLAFWIGTSTCALVYGYYKFVPVNGLDSLGSPYMFCLHLLGYSLAMGFFLAHDFLLVIATGYLIQEAVKQPDEAWADAKGFLCYISVFLVLYTIIGGLGKAQWNLQNPTPKLRKGWFSFR